MVIKYLIYFFITLSLIFPSSKIDEIENNIKNRNEDLDIIKKEIDELEKQINEREKEERTTHVIIIKLDEKIKLTEKLISNLNKEENYLSNLIYKTETNIEIKEKELTVLQNQLKNRVRYLYKYGRRDLLTELIDNQKINNIIYRTKYLQILNDSEDKIKKRINNNITELKLERNALQKEKDRKIFLIAEKDKEFIKLEKDKEKKEGYVNKIKKQKKQLEKNLGFKKDAMVQIEKLITELYSDKLNEKKRQEELQKLRAQNNKATSGNFAKMKQRLPWPVNGVVVGNFGIQTNKKLNTKYENIGIDIKTKSNAKVYSILDGVVSSITMIQGYGNVVIIDHGGGYYSVYSNIDNININENDYVDTLVEIGKVSKNNSNNYYDSDYIFHFQIWGNKEKLNPIDWLLKK